MRRAGPRGQWMLKTIPAARSTRPVSASVLRFGRPSTRRRYVSSVDAVSCRRISMRRAFWLTSPIGVLLVWRSASYRPQTVLWNRMLRHVQTISPAASEYLCVASNVSVGSTISTARGLSSSGAPGSVRPQMYCPASTLYVSRQSMGPRTHVSLFTGRWWYSSQRRSSSLAILSIRLYWMRPRIPHGSLRRAALAAWGCRSGVQRASALDAEPQVGCPARSSAGCVPPRWRCPDLDSEASGYVFAGAAGGVAQAYVRLPGPFVRSAHGCWFGRRSWAACRAISASAMRIRCPGCPPTRLPPRGLGPGASRRSSGVRSRFRRRP